MAVAFVWYAAIIGAFIGLVAYWDMFRRVAELGGPRPRCVVFDADAAQLSADTRAVLFGPAADTAGKHHTVNLYTIFAGGDFVLVKRNSTPLASANRCTASRSRRSAPSRRAQYHEDVSSPGRARLALALQYPGDYTRLSSYSTCRPMPADATLLAVCWSSTFAV